MISGSNALAAFHSAKILQFEEPAVVVVHRHGKGRLVVSQEEALTRAAFVEKRLSFMVKL
jgi:hypothetical protein